MSEVMADGCGYAQDYGPGERPAGRASYTEVSMRRWTASERCGRGAAAGPVASSRRLRPSPDKGLSPALAARTIMATFGMMIALVMSPIVYVAEAVGGPGSSDPLLHAALWMQDTLLGEVVTTLAILVIGAVGFVVATEHLDWRIGAGVVAGCILLLAVGSYAGGALG